jgi:hypothetical protein
MTGSEQRWGVFVCWTIYTTCAQGLDCVWRTELFVSKKPWSFSDWLSFVEMRQEHLIRDLRLPRDRIGAAIVKVTRQEIK